MNKTPKTEYNKSYYQKNRDKILERIRASRGEDKPQPSVISLVQKPAKSTKKVKNQSTPPVWPIWVQGITGLLALAITFYLVRESARFFYLTEGGWIEAYFKALILEGACVVLCLIQVQSKLGRIGTRTLLAIFYVYSVWAISGGVIQRMWNEQQEHSVSQATVQDLEGELAQTRSIRDRYLDLNRLTASKPYDLRVQALQDKVIQARGEFDQNLKTLVNPSLLAALIGFRVLMMLMNLVCLRNLSKLHL